ncbi:MAG: thioredoxin domain-containing protein [Leptolyngbyaceae bacterium]|nr:thioredoxin domain-containing protein [Leptolyngbyaceae bacterium]
MSIPIPRRPSGYSLGAAIAPVQVDVFVDIECPFSQKSWSTVQALREHYAADQVRITVHPVILCDHRQSWDMTKAAVAIASDDAQFWEFFSYLYQRRERFAEDAFDDQNRHDLYALITEFINDFGLTNWDQAKVTHVLNEDDLVNRAKTPIRYAISQGVWSTPTFFINKAEADQLSSSSTLSDWQDVIDPLL